MTQPMNQFFNNRPSPAVRRQSAAFTLIELLVVIAIIGLLAALIVGGAGIASVKARTYRVQAERDALITAIEQYKQHKGYYPPDNTTNTGVNALYYELTGTVFSNNNFYAVSGEIFTTNQIGGLFNISGFLNSSSGATFTLFGVPVPPGTASGFYFGLPNQPIISLWHYVSSNPTNNPSEFDLWMDVTWSGKTNRISNWSKDPQVVH